MTILWLHLRTSPVRWAAPLLVAAYLTMLFDDTRWVGSWPETAAAAQPPAFWLGPVVTALAAWSGSAPWRHGVSERMMATPRPAVTVDAPRLAATALLLALPYLTGQIVAVVATARSFPPGFAAFAGHAPLGASLTLTSVAVGWFAGRRFGSWTSVLVAAVVCAVALQAGQRSFGLLVAGRPQQLVRWQEAGLRPALAALLLAAVLWATPAARRWTGWLSTGALGAALVSVVAAGLPVTPRTLPEQAATCLAGPTRFCLWPEHAKYLPTVRAVADRAAALPAAFVLPSVAGENGIRTAVAPDAPGSGSRPSAGAAFAVRDGSVWSVAGDLAEAVAQRTVDPRPGCPRASADPARRVRLVAWLEAYLAGGGSPDYHDNAPEQVRRLQAEGRRIADGTPREQQFAWAAGELAHLAPPCSPGPAATS